MMSWPGFTPIFCFRQSPIGILTFFSLLTDGSWGRFEEGINRQSNGEGQGRIDGVKGYVSGEFREG
jgi:hypothetical protein